MRRIAIASIALTLSWSGAAQAVTTIFSGYDENPAGVGALPANPHSSAAEANFRAAVSGEGTETFEGFSTGASSPLALAFAGSAPPVTGALTGSGFINTGTRVSPGTGDVYAIEGSQFFQATGTSFDISFSVPVIGFGTYMIDLEAPDDVSVMVTYAAGGTGNFSLASIFGQTPAPGFLPSGSVHFLGLVDESNPITAISFGGLGRGGDQVAFDQMIVASVSLPVPEPATWAMLIAGFGLIGFVLRRRSRARLLPA